MYVGALLRVAYTTVAYYLVGLTPEENHWTKANAWARVNAYRFAAWHWRKCLKYSDDSRARASLGWCYANLGLLDSAAEHYRAAHSRNSHPSIGVGLAQVEWDLGNFAKARNLIEELAARRGELEPDTLAALEALELKAANAGGSS